MTRLAIADLPSDEYARIFGPRTDDAAPGRQRLCRTCGGWHRAGQVPHNCRPEPAPRSHLASPQIAPSFGEFVASRITGEVIGDPKAKREFMAAHDLVDYDEGVTPEPDQTDREWEREFVADFKRAAETDPLNRPPVDVIGQTDTAEAGEIDVSEIEVFK